MDDLWHDDDYEADSYDEDYEYDDNHDDEEEATGYCPECEAEILADAEMCSTCGYWLTTAERHALWDGEARQLKIVGKVVLVVILLIVMLILIIP